MLKGYFDSLPVEMEEAAVIDGANRFTIFWYLILPLAGLAIAATALFSFRTAWNEFILAATILGDCSLFTLPVALEQNAVSLKRRGRVLRQVQWLEAWPL